MVQVWYMDDCDSDQRNEHKSSPERFISLNELEQITGVLYFSINADGMGNFDVAQVEQLCDERGYNYKDVVEIAHDTLPNYDQKLKDFYKEHIHSDEEIRLCIKGSGYFDVRDNNDAWIRIKFVPGDLIILPAGIYHRFTLDNDNYIKVHRFFQGNPVWTPINRPADDHPARVNYLKCLKSV